MGAIAVPFAQAPWLNGTPSPYYTDSHRKWQRTCRAFIHEHLSADAWQREHDGALAPDTYEKFANGGFLIPSLPAPLPVDLLRVAGIQELPGGLKLEEFDYFHFVIYMNEMYECGLWGPAGAIIPGMMIGVPPIISFGTDQLKKRVLPDLFHGRTRLCIGITEPGAGSDVANIETTAVKTDDGRHYRVNGAKKWISSGLWADFVTAAVRTSNSGGDAISLLLIPLKNTPGVTLRKMDISAGSITGTAYIEFDDVLVPIDNLIGLEGQGLKYALTNFNHERLSLAISGLASARKVVAVAFDYVSRRQAFGKPLLDQPVVRWRLAQCGAEVEGNWATIEQLTYSLAKLPKHQADAELGGLTALAKVRSGQILEKCVSSCQLLLGGNGVTLSGQGKLIEMIAREVPLTRIPGGSEDVLLDLGVRQLWKLYQAKTQVANVSATSSSL